jgi:hypothetical protein
MTALWVGIASGVLARIAYRIWFEYVEVIDPPEPVDWDQVEAEEFDRRVKEAVNAKLKEREKPADPLEPYTSGRHNN